jgi:hypothetical protein
MVVIGEATLREKHFDLTRPNLGAAQHYAT